MSSSTENNKSFIEKIWIIVGIVAFAASVLLIVKTSISVLLLVFAGILIAVFFRGLSGQIQRKTGWHEKLCVTIGILMTLILLVGFIWLMGAKVQTQLSELMETLPKTIDHARQSINDTEAGKKAIDELSSQDTISNIKKTASSFFTSTFGVLGDLYVVLFIGIFMTISPSLYIDGLVRIVPRSGREEAQLLVGDIGTMLRKWLKGKLLSMLVVAVLTAIGLAIIGVPLWLVLAIFAGLVSFIPNFGPIIALIPAVLIGLMEGINTALLVVGLYVLIQFIESNFITTTIQKKMVSLPPAMIMIAQLIMGALTGGWGLVLATPIMVVLIVVVQELYIKKMEVQK